MVMMIMPWCLCGAVMIARVMVVVTATAAVFLMLMAVMALLVMMDKTSAWCIVQTVKLSLLVVWRPTHLTRFLLRTPKKNFHHLAFFQAAICLAW